MGENGNDSQTDWDRKRAEAAITRRVIEKLKGAPELFALGECVACRHVSLMIVQSTGLCRQCHADSR